ncbi:DUF4253 domain-containing protein [Streptomyces sp. NPDC004682]
MSSRSYGTLRWRTRRRTRTTRTRARPSPPSPATGPGWRRGNLRRQIRTPSPRKSPPVSWSTGFRAPLALVPAARSADLAAAIGWTGPVGDEDDAARLCAVLRSWEDRFGVRLIALSHDRLDLSVAAPPQTVEDALAVAVEHFAFCPDNVWQGYETLRLYAEEALVGSRHWTFWWD